MGLCCRLFDVWPLISVCPTMSTPTDNNSRYLPMVASYTDQLIVIALNVTPIKSSGSDNVKNSRKWTLEKTDVAVKNGQSRHKTKTNKANNATQKSKMMSNKDQTREWTMAPEKGNQFLPLIRHPPCYSYSQHVLNITIRKPTQIT